MREFHIQKNDSGQRLNKFLEKAVPALPGGLMHKYVRLKRIKVNGKRTEPAYKLCEGDLLQLYINDEFFERPSEQAAYEKSLRRGCMFCMRMTTSCLRTSSRVWWCTPTSAATPTP